MMALLQECQAELTRENRHLASTGSERLIKEHRVSTVGRPGVGGGFLPCLPLTHVNVFPGFSYCRLSLRRRAPSLFVRKGCS